MPEITASQVKELRDATGVSMMECKKALQETQGDLEGALKMLRERGMAVAAKRASKEANQGCVMAAATEDGKTRAMVEVNCETDFVARNDDFKKLVEETAQQALRTDAPLSEVMHDMLMDRIAAIGENLKIRRNVRFTLGDTGVVASYIHMGGKVGVLIEVGCTKPETVSNDRFAEVVRDLTLHVAASAPRYLTPDEVPAEVVREEREIFAKQVEDKPPQVVEKIVDGKLKKFFGEICLLAQGFVKEPKQSIQQLLDETGKAQDDTLTIRRFARYQLGQ